MTGTRSFVRHLVFIIGIQPTKVGGIEIFAREFARQLTDAGWTLVLCFESMPTGVVREYLTVPNVILREVRHQERPSIDVAINVLRVLREFRPEVLIYAFNGVLRLFPWLAVAAGVRIVVYNDHSSRPIGYTASKKGSLRRLIARAIVWPVDRSICVSRYVQECAVADGFLPADRLLVVHNGVDVESGKTRQAKRESFRARFGIGSAEKVVLQVSWMVPAKGVDVLLNVVRAAFARYGKPARLLLIGDGSHRSAYQAMAGQLGIADRVIWTGAILNPTEEGAFAAADIYCQTSQWEEACPLSVLEAMSFSLPVLASRVGGIPELVVHGEGGFLVPRDDVASFSDRLTDLLTSDSLIEGLGSRGRQRVERLFDVRRTVSEYVAAAGVNRHSL